MDTEKRKERYMILREMIEKTRSCRRFHQAERIEMEVLRDLIDLARLGGSARNIQPLKYMLCNGPAMNQAIFPHLGWAGYLNDWPGPKEGERPSAYIVCLLDTSLAREAACDLGIATQNILLGAMAQGLAGCRIGSVSPDLVSVLSLPQHFQILLVLALGYPLEQVVIETISVGDDIRYWRDTDEVHHVPKRSLGELIVTPAAGGS